jgi:hypothetical protein
MTENALTVGSVLFVQMPQDVLLFASGIGSVSLVTHMLEEYETSVDAFTDPMVCMFCTPMKLAVECPSNHSIGKESPLLSACLSGYIDVVEKLLKHGATVPLPNEVWHVFGSVKLSCMRYDAIAAWTYCITLRMCPRLNRACGAVT